MNEARTETRAEKRRQRRAYGFGGEKAIKKGKYRQRNAVDGQVNWCMTLWGRYAAGKKLDELNLDEFFETNKAEFAPEVAIELKGRIGVLIENQRIMDEQASAKPIKQ